MWPARPGLARQWQLGGEVDPSVDVPVHDIDGIANDAEGVARLHRAGSKVMCHVIVGVWEDQLHLSSMVKRPQLDVWRRFCRPTRLPTARSGRARPRRAGRRGRGGGP
ncbi:endo alpha-1,4 polygalactosaminidase [Streptomyces toyocaensis]|uniref:endo alpha-1,4 polygalactosaminidase n=1 Tax=Streptomyces toyocaensis TaxID=55952 RepID=UPI003F4D2067